jgi:hypothetical protein
LDISKNDLGQLIGWKYVNWQNPDYWYQHSDGRHQQEKPEEEIGQRSPGVIALADAIRDSRAMTKLDISSNEIRAERGTALAAGLKGNQVITELNISSNDLGLDDNHLDDTSGVIAIADAIPDMGALTKLMFGQKPVTMTTEMTEADFSGKLRAYEAQIVAAFLPNCR